MVLTSGKFSREMKSFRLIFKEYLNHPEALTQKGKIPDFP